MADSWAPWALWSGGTLSLCLGVGAGHHERPGSDVSVTIQDLLSHSNGLVVAA
jgi:hypothetical protein